MMMRSDSKKADLDTDPLKQADRSSLTHNWGKFEARANAIAQLKEKLTQDEIKTLSKYLAEIVELETSIQTQLMNTIQNGRISAEDDLDFGSGTRDSNFFAENLKTLLDNGVILEDFAKMSQKDQEGFALKANFIGLLVRNGIDFDVLTYLSASDLVSFEDFLTTAQHISKYEMLHTKNPSPEKSRAIEFVTSELNSIAQKARKLKN
jgi:hypothetical protein